MRAAVPPGTRRPGDDHLHFTPRYGVRTTAWCGAHLIVLRRIGEGMGQVPPVRKLGGRERSGTEG